MDLGKINRNVKRIIDQGGTDQQVEQYIKAEGATVQQVLDYKPDQGFMGQVSSALSATGDFLHENLIGKQDPRFKDVPSLANTEGLSFENNPAIGGGSGTDKMFAQTDAQYADVLENRLKQSGQFVSRQQDANGFDLFTFKDEQGVERQAYANKPGWDGQDIDRFITGSIPFLVGGAAVGAVTKGAPLAISALSQAGAAGATSMGSDLIASAKGSKQGIDYTKAAITAGGAGVFEALGPVVKAGLKKKIFGDKKLVTPDGNFTPKGKEKLKELGLEPEQFTPEQALAVKKDLEFSANQTEAAAQIRTDEFGIPTTKGQRTGDVEALQLEEEMRRSLLGRQSKDIMDDFDTLQKKRIEDAAMTRIGRRFDKYDDTIQQEFDRMRGAIPETPASSDLLELGGRVRSGLQSAKNKSDEIEKELWQGLDTVLPQKQAKMAIPEIMQRKINEFGVFPDPELTPNTAQAIDLLTKYVKGEDIRSPFELLGEKVAPMGLDQMRRRLLNSFKASEGQDKVSMKAVYEGFNEWIDFVADQGLLQTGSRDAAARLKAARQFTKESRQSFAPTDGMGRKTPAAKFLEKILDDDKVSPESIVTELFGASGNMGSPKAGSEQAIRHLMQMSRKAFEEGNKEISQMASGLRTAYWVRLVQNKQGNMNAPGVMRNNILSALKNQQSVMKQLYNKEEIASMRRFAKSLDDATFTAPNASGTSYASEAIKRRYSGDNAVKTLLQTQQKRELFSKNNVLMSRIYQFLAKKVPANLLGSKDAAGAALARRATSQELTKKLRPNSKGLGGFIGNQYGSEE